MPFKRLFKVRYAGSSPENASVVRTLFDLFVRDMSASISCSFNSPHDAGVDRHFLVGGERHRRSFRLFFAFFFEFLPFQRVVLTVLLVKGYAVRFHVEVVGRSDLERRYPFSARRIRFVVEIFGHGFVKGVQVWDTALRHC